MKYSNNGCLATLVTLSPEEETTFREIQCCYDLRFEPRDQVEYDLVEQIAWTSFKQRQTWIQETAVLGLQVALDKDKVNMEWLTPSEFDRRALALVASVKDSNALSLLHRYCGSLANQAERAIKLLLELKKQRLPPAVVPSVSEPEAELRKEPSPTNEHSEAQPETPVAYVAYAPRSVRIATPAEVRSASPALAAAA